ncbi:putative SAM-dependent RNA methyltransferase [Teratosphaeria destructans]|uniref:SAM-dependent RNA methyltransferase n=1 Tax=Teratosphaeria destructans TaxID=418781 RepID=A0A9W7VY86_9PEZI|nr:putative SAM-dependent RNA methyltransferase [Teratosphaeria destructans]
MAAPPSKHTFIVEHMDPELEEWQALEYKTIHRECSATGARFILSGVTDAAATQKQLGLPSSSITKQGVESLYPTPAARKRVCLLDPKGEKDIGPEDADAFDAFLFGGILGDDPPRDRTGELRAKGFPGRRLGPEQMTTDTAARVTRIVVQQGKRLDQIPFIDRPEIKLGEMESVGMPFKYVTGEDGKPIMPEGMVQLLIDDMDKGLDGLL